MQTGASVALTQGTTEKEGSEGPWKMAAGSLVRLGMAVHTFSPSAQEAESGGSISKIKASLVCIVSSRTGEA